MHSMHRSSGAYGSSHRIFGSRNGFGAGAAAKQPPPPRKADILMEAGRVAAEYLVSKGFLPPHLLPPTPPCPPEGRTSALTRLGAAVYRRRFPDEDGSSDRRGLRKHWKARRRPRPYDRSYHGSDWSRKNGRERSFLDSREYDDDAPGFSRARRGRFDDGRSRDGPPALRSEVVGKTAPESEDYELVDDAASKVSCSRTKKDAQIQAEVDSNKDALHGCC